MTRYHDLGTQSLKLVPGFDPGSRIRVFEQGQHALMESHVTRDYKAFLGQPYDNITRAVRRAQVKQFDSFIAQLDNLFFLEGFVRQYQLGSLCFFPCPSLHCLQQ